MVIWHDLMDTIKEAHMYASEYKSKGFFTKIESHLEFIEGHQFRFMVTVSDAQISVDERCSGRNKNLNVWDSA